MFINIYLFILCGTFGLIVFKTFFTTYETTGDTESALEQITEYRMGLVNQWISLLGFWLKVEIGKDDVKCASPAFNQTLITFLKDNLEFNALFDWSHKRMVLESNAYSTKGNYNSRKKTFRLANHMLSTDKLYKFVMKAKDEYLEYQELSADDVTLLTQQIKAISTPYGDENEAKEQFFTTMAELMILMRRKKCRRNRDLVNVYANLVHYLWRQHGEQFLEFLKDEEDSK